MGDGLRRAFGAVMQSRLPVRVQVGQVWEDFDSRSRDAACLRKIKVLEIDGDVAICQSSTGMGRKTKIRLDRFRPNSTGYRLVT